MEFVETPGGTVIKGLKEELLRPFQSDPKFDKVARNHGFPQHGHIGPATPPNGMHINVDLTKAKHRSCVCGCSYFTQAVTVHVVSELMSPTGHELIAQVPALICLECKAPLPLSKENK